MLIESENSEGVQVEEVAGSLINNHCTKMDLPIEKGKKKGQKARHFKCNYCDKSYAGPSDSSFTTHLKKDHPSKCPELVKNKSNMPKRDFFKKAKMQGPFDENIFMGKILKWVVRSDQPFSVVDDEDFADLLSYLKKDVLLHSRRTLGRRLEELYCQKKDELRAVLNGFRSKYSITCDVWSAKNKDSFFGFTIHYIDDSWNVKQSLLAFKHLEGEHDGLTLSKAMIEVLEDLGIADRLLGVTADNASNNTTMLSNIETYYNEKYPNAGFSVAWNQVECSPLIKIHMSQCQSQVIVWYPLFLGYLSYAEKLDSHQN